MADKRNDETNAEALGEAKEINVLFNAKLDLILSKVISIEQRLNEIQQTETEAPANFKTGEGLYNFAYRKKRQGG